MKKMILILLLMVPLKLLAPAETFLLVPLGEAIKPYEPLWFATINHESKMNPKAVNTNDPNGGSWGIAQIGQYKLNAYNKSHNTHYTLIDLFDVELSKRIFYWHCLQYPLDFEIISKAWNGSGPATEIYWKKIKVLI